MRPWRRGSVSGFQPEGAGSIPAGRSIIVIAASIVMGAVVLLAIILWLMAPALAHIPMVGGLGETRNVCNEEASLAILIAIGEKGAGAGRALATQYGRRGKCRVFETLETRAAWVSRPVALLSGHGVVYMVEVEFMVVLRGEATMWGGPWYFFHWDER